MTRIQTYLIHGSLGAGKTTILNTILSSFSFEKAVVIENEFANFNIDEFLINNRNNTHKTHSIVGGCICCSSGTELFEILEQISQNRDVKQIIIETTGVANSIDLIKQLVLSSVFDDNFELTKNILVVDSLEEDIDKFVKNKELDIKIADIVFLTKTDISKKDKTVKFIGLLKKVGNKNIFKVTNGRFDTNILIDNKHSGSTKKIIDNIDLLLLQSKSHTENNYYQVLNLKKQIGRKSLTSIINTINLEEDAEVKRIKGFILEKGEAYIVNGAQNIINYIKSDARIGKGALVIIGSKITKELIDRYFKKYV